MVRKSGVILILIFFTGIYSSVGQRTYAPIFKHTGKWYVTFCSNKCYTDFYSTIGDTIVDGFNYRFLDEHHFNKAVIVREDTLDGKVYFKYLYGNRKYEDILMYDFSLNEGDLHSIYNPNSPIKDSLGTYRVDKVDSILTEKGYRKRLSLLKQDTSLGEFLSTVWVEGVGGLSFINTPAVGPELFGFGELSCFVVNDTDYVYKSEFAKLQGKCNINNLKTEQEEHLTKEKAIVVFPNPSSSIIHVSSDNVRIKKLTIMDLNGSIQLVEMNSSNDIDVSILPEGVYFIELLTEANEFIAIKFMKN